MYVCSAYKDYTSYSREHVYTWHRDRSSILTSSRVYLVINC